MYRYCCFGGMCCHTLDVAQIPGKTAGYHQYPLDADQPIHGVRYSKHLIIFNICRWAMAYIAQMHLFQLPELITGDQIHHP